MERRLVFLHKTVSDSRKGVKNVLKSFWRKPRDEGLNFVKGGVRYRYDRIETQILLLADMSFMIKVQCTVSSHLIYGQYFDSPYYFAVGLRDGAVNVQASSR